MDVKYFWFGQDSAAALALRIFAAILTGTFKRLEAIPYENAAGQPALRFRVVRTDESARALDSHDGDVNDSHACPPDCPDD
jgi:hypothetical protein